MHDAHFFGRRTRTMGTQRGVESNAMTSSDRGTRAIEEHRVAPRASGERKALCLRVPASRGGLTGLAGVPTRPAG
jgi:hypothetical protein